MRALESIGDQVKLVAPVAVDRRLADLRAGRYRFNGERTIANLTQLVERGLPDDGP
ncbi:MAG TPA: hypothetical protein VFQ44_23200 [Streptosporangiaceae bacterium]|nr:hypothetical protein [Streptosporangiaceae bacterium]